MSKKESILTDILSLTLLLFMFSLPIFPNIEVTTNAWFEYHNGGWHERGGLFEEYEHGDEDE